MKKTISPIIAFSIIIFIAGIVGAAIFLFSQEIEDEFLIEEEVAEKVEEVIIEEEIFEGDAFEDWKIYISEEEEIFEGDAFEYWKTYISKEYGFEIKHPLSWEKAEILGAESELLLNINFIEPEPDSHERVFWQGSFRIRISPNVKQLNLEEWIKGYTRKAATGVDLIQEIIDTTLNGKNAKKVLVFGFDHTEIIIITINNEMIYNLSFASAGPNDPDHYQHQQIYKQMLSTFRFLD